MRLISINRATMGTNIPDFTRYLKKSNTVYWQALFMPLIASMLGIYGIIAASASKTLYGEYIWDPLALAARWDGPSGRAGAFFVGLCWCVAQIGTNVSANVISCSNDMVSSIFLLLDIWQLMIELDVTVPKVHRSSPWSCHHHNHRRLGYGAMEDHLLSRKLASFHVCSCHLPCSDCRHLGRRLLGREEEAHRHTFPVPSSRQIQIPSRC